MAATAHYFWSRLYHLIFVSAQFVRVHRSYIVNVEKILRIETYEKRNQMLTLA
ncbi:MAG: LytTR family transcriptional regulator, partial [Bacteroidales bacterium]|nr:LytTR family transcriptional regulator [Bacteroidales bacterium]